jgi:RND family efflux transporter MFP subunit
MTRALVGGAAVLCLIGLGTLVLAGRGGDGDGDDPATSAPAPPRVAAANAAPFVGVIVARDAVDVAARTEGRLDSVEVRVGDRVEAGAQIAVIEAHGLRQDLAMAEARLRQAQAEHDRAAVELAAARDRKDRVDRLDAVISEEERTEVRDQLALQTARLGSARASIAEAAARVERLRVKIADARVVAPFAGVVAARYREPGAVVAVGTPIVRLFGAEDRWVRFAIPEGRAGELAVGAQVTVRLPTLGAVISAEITAIAPEVDPSARVIVVEARLRASAAWRARVPAGAEARVEAP